MTNQSVKVSLFSKEFFAKAFYGSQFYSAFFARKTRNSDKIDKVLLYGDYFSKIAILHSRHMPAETLDRLLKSSGDDDGLKSYITSAPNISNETLAWILANNLDSHTVRYKYADTKRYKPIVNLLRDSTDESYQKAYYNEFWSAIIFSYESLFTKLEEDDIETIFSFSSDKVDQIGSIRDGVIYHNFVRNEKKYKKFSTSVLDTYALSDRLPSKLKADILQELQTRKDFELRDFPQLHLFYNYGIKEDKEQLEQSWNNYLSKEMSYQFRLNDEDMGF